MARSLQDARPAASGISRPSEGILPGKCSGSSAVPDHHTGSCREQAKTFKIPVETPQHELKKPPHQARPGT
jgi:hypothetical protein